MTYKTNDDFDAQVERYATPLTITITSKAEEAGFKFDVIPADVSGQIVAGLLARGLVMVAQHCGFTRKGAAKLLREYADTVEAMTQADYESHHAKLEAIE